MALGTWTNARWDAAQTGTRQRLPARVATKEVAAIPKATVEAKAVPDAEPKSNHSALPSKISQSVWDTSASVTTKVTGAATFSPYADTSDNVTTTTTSGARFNPFGKFKFAPNLTVTRYLWSKAMGLQAKKSLTGCRAC